MVGTDGFFMCSAALPRLRYSRHGQGAMLTIR
jgi:hypothetical protein